MRSYVELFDLRSGNVIANYGDENKAWEALRQAVAEFGPEEINGLALTQVQDGHEILIAMEDELVRRVAHEMSSDTVSTEASR